MPKTNEKITIDLSLLKTLECCDCGLVHTISYEEKDGTIFLSFERNEPKTEEARIARVGGKGKLMCLLLDDAIARDGGMRNVK